MNDFEIREVHIEDAERLVEIYSLRLPIPKMGFAP